MLNFRKNRKTDVGILIGSKTIDSSTKQVLIQVSDFTYSPNEGELYLISLGGLNPINKRIHYSVLKNIPDENNILSFDLQNSKLLNSLKPGDKIKIKGPFMNCSQKAS